MSKPPQPDQPEESGYYEVHERREYPALNQLAQARNEKTHQRRDDITGRTLTHNIIELWTTFRMNNSVRLDNHKGSLPITCHSDHHRPVRIQSADNALKIVHIGNGLSINLFDDISGLELLAQRTNSDRHG